MKSMLFAVLLAAPMAQAHDFWIHPDKFITANETALPFTLQAGHGQERQGSRIPSGRILKFGEMTPLGQTIDQRTALGRSAAPLDGTPGVHALFMVTDNRAQSHLPAYRFNAYLRDEGLTPALAHRAKARRMNQPGAERYSRVAKALVQVGPAGSGGPDQASRALGLPLEIVLDRSPYLVPRTAMLPVRVLYQGRPLAGGLVKLTNLDDDAAPVDTQLTDAAGNASFRMPPAGSWLLNVVWTKPLPPGEGIDYETIFSSLSFRRPKSLI